MNLTDDQRRELREGAWTHWTDPDTGREYVVVPREHFERMQTALDGVARRAGWDDPALDAYEQYRKPK
jgi:hypothetical protein